MSRANPEIDSELLRPSFWSSAGKLKERWSSLAAASGPAVIEIGLDAGPLPAGFDTATLLP